MSTQQRHAHTRDNAQRKQTITAVSASATFSAFWKAKLTNRICTRLQVLNAIALKRKESDYLNGTDFYTDRPSGVAKRRLPKWSLAAHVFGLLLLVIVCRKCIAVYGLPDQQKRWMDEWMLRASPLKRGGRLRHQAHLNGDRSAILRRFLELQQVRNIFMYRHFSRRREKKRGKKLTTR